MRKDAARDYVQNLLTIANVQFNGNRPWDIRLIDDRTPNRILADGSLGLGESYMDGWWECERLDELSYHLCLAKIEKQVQKSLLHFLYVLSSKIFNYQTKKLAKQVAEHHYDLNNHLFELMLGPSMAYSCAYWKNANELTAGQLAKYELLCKKLQLTSKDTVLDIGCGWGGLAAYAAEHYGCYVTAISIAAKQISYAKTHYKHLPIEFHEADYRDTAIYNPAKKPFTKLVSVGFFEHLGPKNYVSFFQQMRAQLTDEGLFLLHTIGSNETVSISDPWSHKYIFPHGVLPSMKQLSIALEPLFIVEDWHNFGVYYDKTLLAWDQNFVDNWDQLQGHFDSRFYRMWRYYLLMCAGMFRARMAQVWQIVLSKEGVKGGYESIR